MTLSTFLEGLMLLCFGASWPAAIIKTVRAKNPAGKSILFLSLLLLGYVAGITWRILDYSPIVWFYLLNTGMVATDLGLTLYYLKRIHRNGCS